MSPSIADLILRRGDVQAQGVAAQGQIAGNLATQLGQIPGNAYRNLLEQKTAAQIGTLREQQIAEGKLHQAAQARALTEEQGLRTLFSKGEPDAQDVYQLVGPERGEKIMTGLAATQEKNQQNYTSKQGLLGALAGGVLALPEGLREGAYQFARRSAIQHGVVTADQLPAQYDPALVARAYLTTRPAKAPFTLAAGEQRFEPADSVEALARTLVGTQAAPGAAPSAGTPPGTAPAATPAPPPATIAGPAGVRLPEDPTIASSDPRDVPGPPQEAFPPEPSPGPGDRVEMPVAPWGTVRPGAQPMPPPVQAPATAPPAAIGQGPTSAIAPAVAAPAPPRYTAVAGVPLKPTEEQDAQRYRQIIADQQLGRAVPPDALAWAAGYKNQKEIGPAATDAAAMNRQTVTIQQQVDQQRRAQDFAEKQAGRADLSTKVEQPYLDAREKAGTLRSVIEAARGGNMEAGAVQSLMGVLGLVTTEGVKRINNVELAQVAGAGSLMERIKSQAGKLTSGAPLSPKLQSDLEELSTLLERGAREKYETGFRAITKRYGLTDEEMVPAGPGGASPPAPANKNPFR